MLACLIERCGTESAAMQVVQLRVPATAQGYEGRRGENPQGKQKG